MRRTAHDPESGLSVCVCFLVQALPIAVEIPVV